jgi:hypothetical protein
VILGKKERKKKERKKERKKKLTCNEMIVFECLDMSMLHSLVDVLQKSEILFKTESVLSVSFLQKKEREKKMFISFFPLFLSLLSLKGIITFRQRKEKEKQQPQKKGKQKGGAAEKMKEKAEEKVATVVAKVEESVPTSSSSSSSTTTTTTTTTAPPSSSDPNAILRDAVDKLFAEGYA